MSQETGKQGESHSHTEADGQRDRGHAVHQGGNHRRWDHAQCRLPRRPGWLQADLHRREQSWTSWAHRERGNLEHPTRQVYERGKGVKSSKEEKNAPTTTLLLTGNRLNWEPRPLESESLQPGRSGPLGCECDGLVTGFSSPELILIQDLEVKAWVRASPRHRYLGPRETCISSLPPWTQSIHRLGLLNVSTSLKMIVPNPRGLYPLAQHPACTWHPPSTKPEALPGGNPLTAVIVSFIACSVHTLKARDTQETLRQETASEPNRQEPPRCPWGWGHPWGHWEKDTQDWSHRARWGE